jgi:flagellar hook-length control protein FliK
MPMNDSSAPATVKVGNAVAEQVKELEAATATRHSTVEDRDEVQPADRTSHLGEAAGSPAAYAGTSPTGEVVARSLTGHNGMPVVEQVAQAILSREGGPQQPTEIHLRLEPPELGTVRIHLRASEEGITARLVVQEEIARQLIEGQLQHLKQRLQEAGLSLGRFDVHREGAGSEGRHERGLDRRFADHEEFIPVRDRDARRSQARHRLGVNLINVIA